MPLVDVGFKPRFKWLSLILTEHASDCNKKSKKFLNKYAF